MRGRAARAFGYAVLASLLAHALVLVALPAAREFAAPMPPEAEPLIARVEHLEPLPAPVPVAKREPEPAPVPAPVRAPAPVLQARTPAPPAPAPVVLPEPEPASKSTPAPPAPPAPAPAAALAPAAPAPRPAPPAIDPAVRSDYARRINEEAERFKDYPRVAIDNNWRGEVALRMAIDREGRTASLRVTRSSGHRVLDEQALEMFGRAKPRVRLPAALRGRAFELELRAVFRLEG